MPQYIRMIALWLLLCALLISCTPTVEPTIAGTWAVCHNGRDGTTVFGGPMFEEIVRFHEDGTFHVYPKHTFLLDSTTPQLSGEYKLLTVEGTATSAQGEMQLTPNTPAPISVRVPCTYLAQSPDHRGILLLATDDDYFPCQPCALCQAIVVRVD